MLCEVLKPISGPGGEVFAPGAKVDVSTWRWARQLITQHKIRPIMASPASPAEVEAEVAFPRRKAARQRKAAEEKNNGTV